MKICEWKHQEENYYETDCKQAFTFYEDGPEENQFKFCPYCGKKIKVGENV